MSHRLNTLLDEASAELSRQVGRGMSAEKHAAQWHKIERMRFHAEHDEESAAEARMEEMMLGNWDAENGHPIN